MTTTTIIRASESDIAYLVHENPDWELVKEPKYTVARHRIIAWSIEDDDGRFTATPIFAGMPAEDCYVGIITPEGKIFDPETDSVYETLHQFLENTVDAVELTLDNDASQESPNVR